ncbi:hypothetical protein Drose_18060 [Dactylosporangium roseum]|uniref:Uncharacterized protein n=1 Tax=Dactylosporangium roseum TaxID=47989 RepID=A0ABY5ZCZ3_9ACTN|nr:hypothetical protein [Dactylosporangium roseum]UWZ39939.1 hypothetical protein Drose_18060 [Dactylosporangium roseum]
MRGEGEGDRVAALVVHAGLAEASAMVTAALEEVAAATATDRFQRLVRICRRFDQVDIYRVAAAALTRLADAGPPRR